MTPGQLIDLLEKSGMLKEESPGVLGWHPTMQKAEAFSDLVAAAEREACAKLLDDMAERDKLSNYYAVAARAIRERKQDPMPLFDDWNKDWK